MKMMKSSLRLLLKPALVIVVLIGGNDHLLAQKTVIKTNDKLVIIDGDEVRRHSQTTSNNSFNIEYKGTIEVTDDDKDIKSISSGGYLEISKTTFGSKRSVLIEATSTGLRKEYYEGRSKVNYEPGGRKWLAEILPEVLRSTGIGAESRVRRLYQRDGINAVLNEIAELESDYVKSIYARSLLSLNNFSDKELIQMVNSFSDEIDSDYNLAEILKNNSAQFLKNDKTSEAYFNAVKSIDSDYYSTVVLKEALKDHRPSASSVRKIMEASKNIGSDYYQMTILNDLLDDDLDGKTLAEIIETSKNINSDYYQSHLLSKALQKKNISKESFNAILEAIANVNSDYYITSIFSKLIETDLDDDVNLKIIQLVKEKIPSDYYASSVLIKMMKNQQLSDRTIDQLATNVENLGSSNYAVDVIRAASQKDNISKNSLLKLIKSAGDINSDYYASVALESLAPLVKNSDQEVKDAYRSAAKKIHSDTYYGRAIRALD